MLRAFLQSCISAAAGGELFCAAFHSFSRMPDTARALHSPASDLRCLRFLQTIASQSTRNQSHSRYSVLSRATRLAGSFTTIVPIVCACSRCHTGETMKRDANSKGVLRHRCNFARTLRQNRLLNAQPVTEMCNPVVQNTTGCKKQVDKLYCEGIY